jgi:hypothetical protein
MTSHSLKITGKFIFTGNNQYFNADNTEVIIDNGEVEFSGKDSLFQAPIRAINGAIVKLASKESIKINKDIVIEGGKKYERYPDFFKTPRSRLIPKEGTNITYRGGSLILEPDSAVKTIEYPYELPHIMEWKQGEFTEELRSINEASRTFFTDEVFTYYREGEGTESSPYVYTRTAQNLILGAGLDWPSTGNYLVFVISNEVVFLISNNSYPRIIYKGSISAEKITIPSSPESWDERSYIGSDLYVFQGTKNTGTWDSDKIHESTNFELFTEVYKSNAIDPNNTWKTPEELGYTVIKG